MGQDDAERDVGDFDCVWEGEPVNDADCVTTLPKGRYRLVRATAEESAGWAYGPENGVFSDAPEEGPPGGLTRNGQPYDDAELLAYYRETRDSEPEWWTVEPFMRELARRGFTHFEKPTYPEDGPRTATVERVRDRFMDDDP